MKKYYLNVMIGLLALWVAGNAVGESVSIPASKDNFSRTSKRFFNYGKNVCLTIGSSPGTRSLIAFDLSGVTNEISAATLRLHANNSASKPISLQVCPMVYTAGNMSWKEGAGRDGKNVLANPGDACFSFRSFNKLSWENAKALPVNDLYAAGLWNGSVVKSKKIPWVQGVWVEIPLSSCIALNESLETPEKAITFGLWGTAGNGWYLIDSRESQFAPELVLELKDVDALKK